MYITHGYLYIYFYLFIKQNSKQTINKVTTSKEILDSTFDLVFPHGSQMTSASGTNSISLINTASIRDRKKGHRCWQRDVHGADKARKPVGKNVAFVIARVCQAGRSRRFSGSRVDTKPREGHHPPGCL